MFNIANECWEAGSYIIKKFRSENELELII